LCARQFCSGNRRPRGARQLGDYIQQTRDPDNDTQDTPEVSDGASSRLNSEQSQYEPTPSDAQRQNVDDSENYSNRGPRRYGDRGMARGGRGRYSDTRQRWNQPSDDRLRNSFSDDENPGRRRNFPNDNSQSRRYERTEQYRSDKSTARGGGYSGREYSNGGIVKNYEAEAPALNDNDSGYHRRSRGGRRDATQGAATGGSWNQKNSENWEDESDQPSGGSAVQRERQMGTSRGPGGDGRGRRPQNFHTTRTISNTHYRGADADGSLRARDRSSQLGGVVAAMNKISLNKDQAGTVPDDNVESGARAAASDRRRTIVTGGKLILH
jgi:hypothetical protein